MYIVSKDTTEQQKELSIGIREYTGENSLPFISDPDFTLIDTMGMKDQDSAARGYGLLDTNGNVVFQTQNDHWGEEIEKTAAEIKKEYNKLTD